MTACGWPPAGTARRRDPKLRICGRTVWIPDLTHRRAPSSAQKPWDMLPQKVR